MIKKVQILMFLLLQSFLFVAQDNRAVAVVTPENGVVIQGVLQVHAQGAGFIPVTPDNTPPRNAQPAVLQAPNAPRAVRGTARVAAMRPRALFA